MLCLSDRLDQPREKVEGFEKSIEFSFNTITAEKLRMISNTSLQQVRQTLLQNP